MHTHTHTQCQLFSFRCSPATTEYVSMETVSAGLAKFGSGWAPQGREERGRDDGMLDNKRRRAAEQMCFDDVIKNVRTNQSFQFNVRTQSD